MITHVDKWESVQKIGDFEIKKQYIEPHDRYLHAVFGWSTIETGVQTGKYHRVFREQCSWWTDKECINWINSQNIKP